MCSAKPNSTPQHAPAAGGTCASPPVVDVAVNIFAKPYQTSLSLLSLLRASRRHIGEIYLQFEPFGSEHDCVSPYLIVAYLQQLPDAPPCRVSQPDYWLDLNAADLSRIDDPAYRYGIRYQYAFEHSTASLLFLMHNDIFVQRDILGALVAARGDAFAIGQLGQCWNCPASRASVTEAVMHCPPCTPETHAQFRPDYDQLVALYVEARRQEIFVRPYDQAFTGIFDAQAWPLPECRINEWACLLDLTRTRPLTLPLGAALPPGAYRQCGPVCLDIGVEWFRAMYAHGLHARHFPVQNCLQHWVGTGKVTRHRYMQAENNALRLLQKHFPDYVVWLRQKSGQNI